MRIQTTTSFTCLTGTYTYCKSVSVKTLISQITGIKNNGMIVNETKHKALILETRSSQGEVSATVSSVFVCQYDNGNCNKNITYFIS